MTEGIGQVAGGNDPLDLVIPGFADDRQGIHPAGQHGAHIVQALLPVEIGDADEQSEGKNRLLRASSRMKTWVEVQMRHG